MNLRSDHVAECGGKVEAEVRNNCSADHTWNLSKIVHNRIFGPTILNTIIVNIFSLKSTTERVLRTPITIIHTPPPPITVIEDVVSIFLFFFRVSYLSCIFNSNFTWCPEKLGCNDIGLIGDWPWEDLWVNDNSTSPHNYHRGYCELLTSELNTYSMDLNTW